jgi:hypothetical protein
MNRCINKIETSQNIIDSFFKNFLKNENVYDPYQVSVWLRFLDSFLNQVSKTAVLTKTTEFITIAPFLKEFKQEYSSGKSKTLRKDISEFLIWRFGLPFWKSYFINKSNVETFEEWFYQTFKVGLSRSLTSVTSSIFIGLSKMHGIQVIEKLSVDNEADKSVTPESLKQKIIEIVDFNQDILAGVKVKEPSVLVKKQIVDPYIIKGYTCQLDAVVFNFTTNRLIGNELSKNLK